jgi:tetratricopeptide (TPR) repeat protein
MARWLLASLLLLLGSASVLGAQEAPLLTVLPRQEEARQQELRGDLRMIRKNYWQAVDFYQEALRYSPKNPILLNKIGIAYHQLSRLGDAKKYYERATKADKKYAQAWNNLGTVHYGRKNYKKAIRYYRRALEYNPAQAAVRGNLGAALFARKKNDEALEEFRLALLLNPEIFQQRNLFGVLMQDYSVQDRARFHFLLAKSFGLLGNVESCLLYLRRALEEGLPTEEAQADPAFFLVSEDRRFHELFAAPPAPLQP